MLQVTRTPAAVRDLTAIVDYIAADNLTAALRLYDEIDRTLGLIASFPKIGQAVDELGAGVRRQSIGDYLLFYRVTDKAIELIRVLHGSRDIDRLS